MKTMMAVITNSPYLFQDFVLNHKNKGDKVALITMRKIVINFVDEYYMVTSVDNVRGMSGWTGYHEIYDFHYQPELNNIKDAIKRRSYDNSNFSETCDSSPVHQNIK